MQNTSFSRNCPNRTINSLYDDKIAAVIKANLLSKNKKKSTIIELEDPKKIRKIKDKRVLSGNSLSQNELSLPVPDIESSHNKNRKKKDLYTISTEKNYRTAKGKGKNKDKSYDLFSDEKNNKNSLINVDEKKVYSTKQSNTKKNRGKLTSLASLVDTSPISKPKEINVSAPLSIKDLANIIGKAEAEIIKFLFLQGIAITINEVVDLITIEKIGQHFDIRVNIDQNDNPLQKSKVLEVPHNHNNDVLDANLQPRAPVVVVMGHVDHGKTSLLDKIRETQVSQNEAGGITQVLNAYSVTYNNKGKNEDIVFLDTPGHAAFSQMRLRGASIMDVAILVVATDDMVQPQTIECLNYIRTAGVPMIVALNKIDKENANIEKIKEQLAEQNVISEEWGGDTVFVPVSALTGDNIDNLLESVLLVASMQDLRADMSCKGKGIIIETQLDKTKGISATVLVQQGVFKKGDAVTALDVMGKIRMITNESQEVINQAGPSQIIKIWGFYDQVQVNEELTVHSSDKEARARIKEVQVNDTLISSKIGGVKLNGREAYTYKADKVLNVILKANAQGILEAIIDIIKEIPQDKIVAKVLSYGLGEITETDVAFASTTNAIIIGFDTTLAPGAKQASSRLGVTICEHQVIYHLLDDLETRMRNLLDPEYDKKEIGLSVVKDIFELARGKVAGCYVKSGKLLSNSMIEVIRKEEIIYEGKIDSLKRIKEDVEEVNSGNECGVMVKSFQEWRKEDTIKAFTLVEKKPSLI